MKVFSQRWIKGLQTELLSWFQIRHRDYPWRETNDVYKILLAEKLLQQTRANSDVIKIYSILTSIYPTIFDLAKADIEEVKMIIKPLGLSFRAKHIVTMANQVVENYCGQIPAQFPELMKLMGVGEYCAKAVLSFGYQQDIAIVDTNVGRFLFRLLNIKKEFPANPSRKKYLAEAAQSLIPVGKSKSFNLAILDLCALICLPHNPNCSECPINKYCQFENKSLKEGSKLSKVER